MVIMALRKWALDNMSWKYRIIEILESVGHIFGNQNGYRGIQCVFYVARVDQGQKHLSESGEFAQDHYQTKASSQF